MRPIVPLANLGRRLPEAGRIRTGVKETGRTKAGKAYERPKAIDTFRFTSADEAAIGQVAAIYGGTPERWVDAPTPGQWQVITEAAEIHVVLPPDPLGSTPLYEMWTNGGCQRRCDGVTAQVPTTGPDGTEMADVACLCTAKGEMACSPHTRLSVVLPDVRFAGTWRYESARSWAVAQELPGMVELIQSLQERGLTRALLALEHRKTTTAGETHRFTIPVLRVAESMDALVAGAARVGALPATDRPAAGELSAAMPAPDNEIVDAELVDEDAVPAMTATQQSTLADGLASLDALQTDELRAWWKTQQLPRVDDLKRDQAETVLDRLAALQVGADA